VDNRKAYLLVEGHGELEAAHNLVVRLGCQVGFPLPWAKPRRWPNLHQWEASRSGGVLLGAELVRKKPDVGALLILKDEDDGCPKELAPAVADRLRNLNLPFPTAYVLLRPEYEVLFLPCLSMLGFPDWDKPSWEARRGIKEWLSKQLPSGRSYKPTVDQLPFTQKIDLDTVRTAAVPCFGSLERAVAFLRDNLTSRDAVYP
jgi:hypothetical protein